MPLQRTDTPHRLMFYISQCTSSRAPEWRDATIEFLWELYELRETNPAISMVVHKVDGIYLYHDSTPLAYFHLRQRHILVMAAPGYFLWAKKNRSFRTLHRGSWPVMWKCKDPSELRNFMRRINALRKKKPATATETVSRYIPREVREEVLERDRGRCQARTGNGIVCGSTINLH